MASGPPHSPPQVPARSQRPAGKVLLIVGLILAMMVALAVFAIYMGVRILTHNVSIREVRNRSGEAGVTIKTPAGNLAISHGVGPDVELLGLPLYPGAKRVTDDGNASVTANLPSHRGLSVLAAKFETGDPLAKVRHFYANQLHEQITRYIRKDSEGKAVFEIKSERGEKVVALRQADDGTSIELVKVVYGENAVN